MIILISQRFMTFLRSPLKDCIARIHFAVIQILSPVIFPNWSNSLLIHFKVTQNISWSIFYVIFMVQRNGALEKCNLLQYVDKCLNSFCSDVKHAIHSKANYSVVSERHFSEANELNAKSQEPIDNTVLD